MPWRLLPMSYGTGTVLPMGWVALCIACAAAVAAVLPDPGMFVGMGAGVAAMAMGLVGYRRRGDKGPARLAGAGAITLGVIALCLSLGRYAITLMALGKLESLL